MDQDYIHKYGEHLKLFRTVRKISQSNLELKAGINFGTVCRIEKGKINPTKETLYKIALALSLEISEIQKLFLFDELFSKN